MDQQATHQDLRWGGLLTGPNQQLAAALLLASNQQQQQPSPVQETALNLSLSAGETVETESPDLTNKDAHQQRANTPAAASASSHNNTSNQTSATARQTTANYPECGQNLALEAQLLALYSGRHHHQQQQQHQKQTQQQQQEANNYVARLIGPGAYLWPAAGGSSSLNSSGSSSSSTGSWSPERAASISSPNEVADIYLAHQQHHQNQQHQAAQHNHQSHGHLSHNHNRNQQHQTTQPNHDSNSPTQQQPTQAAQRPLFMSSQSYELRTSHRTDSDDLDKIRDFIEQFKARRGALGLTQKQAAQCFRAYTRDRYAFSDNFVGHFEGFQFRPQTAMTIADSLSEWLEFAEEETRQNKHLTFMPGKVKETRKRKYEVIRIRDSAKRILVDAFEKNKSPSSSELEMLSRRTNIPSRNIEIFFKNRRTSRQYHQ